MAYLSIADLRAAVTRRVAAVASTFSVGSASTDDMTQDTQDAYIQDALRVVARRRGDYSSEADLDGSSVETQYTDVVADLAAGKIISAMSRTPSEHEKWAMSQLMALVPEAALDLSSGETPETAPTSGDGRQVFGRGEIDDFRDAYGDDD